MLSFQMCNSLPHIIRIIQIENKCRDGACDTCGGQGKCIEYFGRET
jgi:hypothetical protein